MLKRLIVMAALGLTTVTLNTACSTAFIDSERDANVRIQRGHLCLGRNRQQQTR